jgi:UDP:flavonoid glycosyltransferase YjiC (YdhE family)
LGSNLLAEDLGRDRFAEIMNALRELTEFNFVCKCNAKFIRNNPQNVLFVDWFQQNELLGRERYFISDASINVCAKEENDVEILIKFQQGIPK